MSASPGDIRVDVDVIDQEWERMVIRLSAASGRSIGEILMQQARIAVREMANILPPMGTLTGRESWAAQRRLQIRAINRDLARVYITRSRVYAEIRTRVSPQAAAGWWALTLSDPVAAQRMLRTLDIPWRHLPVGTDPDPAHHRAARNRRGRVPATERGRQIVLRSPRLERYRRQTHRGIGRLKGGMVPAAGRLNVSGIPAWVRRNAGPGLALVDIRRRDDPSVRVANLVSYARFQNAGNRLMRIVIRNRQMAMQRQLTAAARGQWRRTPPAGR